MKTEIKSAEDIYKAVRDEIFAGKLNPGERLVEKDLCERLGSSRGYVREALKMLNVDGFVVISRGKGATVTKISHQDIKNLYEILGALEAKSVELAAPNMTSDDLNDLAVFNEKMKDCINAKDRASARRIWQEANLEYHRLFAARSGNTELSALVESIRWRTFDFKYVVLFEPYYPLFVEQHEALISSVRSKNFKKAEQLMSNHVKKACEVLLHSLEKIPGR